MASTTVVSSKAHDPTGAAIEKNTAKRSRNRTAPKRPSTLVRSRWPSPSSPSGGCRLSLTARTCTSARYTEIRDVLPQPSSPSVSGASLVVKTNAIRQPMTALRMASGIVPAADPLSSAAKSAPKNGARSTVAEPAASTAMTAGVNSLDQPLEDQPVGDGGTVSAKRMICSSLGQEDSKLLPYTFDDVWLKCGHGEAPSIWEASATPQMIEHPCPFYIRTHSLLAQAPN